VRQSQGTQVKDVDVKVTSRQRQDVCFVLTIKPVNLGTIGPGNTWGYTETIE
jgi:hypothetical protein